MQKLRKILLFNKLYYLLLLMALLYAFINNILIKHYSVYDNATNFTGTIKNFEIDGDKVTVQIKAREVIQGTYYLKTIEEKDYFLNNLKYGSKVELSGELNNPINNTIPNTFNYKKYLYNKGIYKILNITTFTIISNKMNVFYAFKNNINERIKNIDNDDYVKTFILGDKNGIDSEIFSNYQTLGVTHLFAISGMHIGLFALVILFILKKFNMPENKALFVTMIVIGIYGALTGFPASIRRAYVLFIFVSLNKIFELKIKSINLLILTIIINILFDSFIIYDIGFLYSTVTTAGLIISNKDLKTGNYFIKLLKVSIISYLFSMPITINNFFVINPLSPINNLFIVPLVSLIIYPLSLIVFIFPFLNIIFSLSINVLQVIESLLIKINIFNIVIPKLSFIFIIIYYVLLLLIIIKNKKALSIIIILIFIFKIYAPYFDDNGYVYFLDIGQGDSSLIIAPYRRTVTMIDTGGKLPQSVSDWQIKNKNYNVSDNTITFMHSLGISKIDELILSHGDEDHAGDALNIINKIKVGKSTLNQGKKNNLEVNLPVLNGQVPYSNISIKNLNYKDYDDENANSQIDLVSIYNTKILYMGDAGKKQELDLINQYKIKANILKLGHHGSKTSSDSEFLKTINPQLSIISSGRKNRFNHPSQETLDTLNNLNLKYLNTQTSGTVEMIITKKDYKIIEYKP